MNRYTLTWLIRMAVVGGLLLMAFGCVLGVVPMVVGFNAGLATRPAPTATASPVPTNTPVPHCLFGDVPVAVAANVTEMKPGQADQPITVPGYGKYTFSCSLDGERSWGLVQDPTATIPPTATVEPIKCVDGSFRLDKGDQRVINGELSTCQADGNWRPNSIGPATATPTLAPTMTAIPTATPKLFDCPASYIKAGANGNALNDGVRHQREGTTDLYVCTEKGWSWAGNAP